MKTLTKRVSWLIAALAIVLAAAITVSVFGLGAFTRAKAADDDPITVTIKLNGGKLIKNLTKASDDADETYEEMEGSPTEVSYTAGSKKLTLDYDTIYNIFGHEYAPLKPDSTGKFLGEVEPMKGQWSDPKLRYYRDNALLFGLFVDTNGDGEPMSKGEKIYYSGDTIDLTTLGPDKTLTCYYADNGYMYSQPESWQNQQKYTIFAKAWKDDKVPVNGSGERRNYTARDMMPLYQKIYFFNDKAFSLGDPYCDVIGNVEIPYTVEKIGYQTFSNLQNVQITGMENVYGTDNGAFRGTRIEKFVFKNVSNGANFDQWTFMLDAAQTRVIIEKWQNDGAPAFKTTNPWFGVNGASITNPKGYIYVVKGTTKAHYDGIQQGANFRLYDTSVPNAGKEVSNIPMREFYKITFDLNGASGKIENQHVDAGAVSVKDGDGADANELNLTSYNSDNTEQLTATNEPAKNLDLLYATMPEAPERDGYVFTGWKDEATGEMWTAEDFGATGVKSLTMTGNVTLKAQWTEAVTVTFKPNNGASDIVNNKVALGGKITAPTAPTAPAGKTFDKWYKDEQLTQAFDFETEEASDGLVIYAGYSLINYTVTYELNGGTAGANAPATYTIESADITLVAPARDGYTFGGWYDNADCTGEAVTKIATGSTGNKKFYAKWTANAATDPDPDNGGDNNGDNNGGNGTTEPAPKKGCKNSATATATTAVGAGVALLGAAVAICVSKKRKA